MIYACVLIKKFGPILAAYTGILGWSVLTQCLCRPRCPELLMMSVAMGDDISSACNIRTACNVINACNVSTAHNVVGTVSITGYVSIAYNVSTAGNSLQCLRGQQWLFIYFRPHWNSQLYWEILPFICLLVPWTSIRSEGVSSDQLVGRLHWNNLLSDGVCWGRDEVKGKSYFDPNKLLREAA